MQRLIPAMTVKVDHYFATLPSPTICSRTHCLYVCEREKKVSKQKQISKTNIYVCREPSHIVQQLLVFDINSDL